MVEDIVRKLILDGIESGRFPAGSRLPGARELAAQCGLSFLMVQRAISSLVQNGLITCFPRRGAFVKQGWEERLLANHLVLFSTHLHWIPEFRKLLAQELPQLRLCSGFKRGMFEIRTTYYLQRDRDQYMDLGPLLKRCIPNPERLYQFPFNGFLEPDGRLFGIPFIFSPRVMYCNPQVLKQHSLPVPSADWTWDEFLHYIRILRRKRSDIEVLNYDDAPYWWMSLFLRAGGKFADRRDGKSLVLCLDTPETLRAIHILRELYQILKPQRRTSGSSQIFLEGNQAFSLSKREFYSRIRQSGFRNWTVLPLPRIPGGRLLSAQATDLICIRKECADEPLAENFIRFMLSSKVQNFFGKLCYGIPILKSAAEKSFRESDGRDALFRQEMEHISTEYNIDSSSITELIYYRMNQLIRDTAPLEPALTEFSHAVNRILATRKEMLQDPLWL